MFQDVTRFDVVAKLETLSQDLGTFLDLAGLDPRRAAGLDRPHPSESATKGKITNSAERSEFLTPSNRRLIEDLYKEDFETFFDCLAEMRMYLTQQHAFEDYDDLDDEDIEDEPDDDYEDTSYSKTSA